MNLLGSNWLRMDPDSFSLQITEQEAPLDFDSLRMPCWLMLAIKAELPGKGLCVWKLPVDERHHLRQVIEHWSRKYDLLERWADLPVEVRAIASPGGPDLDLNRSLKTLMPSLTITAAGLSLTIIWPKTAERGGNGVLKARSSGLGKLRISTRYASVNNADTGFHKSSTMRAKLDAGVYQDTSGKFAQTAFIKAMRTPPLPSRALLRTQSLGDSGEAMATRILVVLGRSVEGAGSKELFGAALKGPASLVANWEATCERLERRGEVEKSIPYPVFIPTYGRVHKANLNWNADHVFGPIVPGKDKKLHPVICIVVEPSQEEEYREVWPHVLMLVLPENGRGAGFARWVIQKTCTRAIVRPQQSRNSDVEFSRESWKVRRLPFCWIADDGISMFYKLVGMDANGADGKSGCRRVTERKAPEGKPMFQEAFLSVQANPILSRIAVAGFLRDDGTAVCKRLEWKTNELSLYKIVLLNLGALKTLGVEYEPDLHMYEDICLTHEVLLKDGGGTLKCQKYCFRASHVKHGGCADQRVRSGGTLLRDLISLEAWKTLPSARKHDVWECLQRQRQHSLFGWVRLEPLNCSVDIARSCAPFHTDTTHRHILNAYTHTPKELLRRSLEKSKVLDVETEARNIALCPRVSVDVFVDFRKIDIKASSSIAEPDALMSSEKKVSS